MFKSYFKIAVRNLLRRKIYVLINILGLVIGMACSFLILLLVLDELGYDRHFSKAGQIYRLVTDQSTSVGTRPFAAAPTAWGLALKAEYPEIKNMARMWPYTQLAFYKERPFKVVNLRVDSTFFEMFDLPLIQGNPKTPLDDPWKIILSKQTAQRTFGEENPMGKFIEIDTEINLYQVAGVMEEVPANSHFTADVVTLFNPWMHEAILPNWTVPRDIYTYFELPDPKAVRELELKMPAFLARHLPKEKATRFIPSLQPLTDIHLRSHRIGEILPNADIRYVYLFASLALFILLIACFNFMNLATANSADRAKEVGMRKTLGAQRLQLIGQFLGEAVLLSCIAFLLALIIVELGLPIFNALSGKNLLLQSIFADKLTIAGFLLGTIFVGIFAGAYPAFFLSAHKPVDTLRGRLGAVSGGEALRKGLVILQFTLAIALMTATVVVYQQLRYLQNQRLGFDKEHVVILPIVEDRNMKYKKDLFKSEMLQHPAILKVTAASHVPGDKIGLRGNDDIDLREYRLEGVPEIFHAAYLDADHDFAATLDLDLLAGRWFAKEMATDSSAFVVNEAAARLFGMVSPEDILGKRLTRFKRYPDSTTIHIQGLVIGVVRDFHYASLHENVKPLIFNLPIERWDANRFAIKIAAEDIRGALDFLAAKWQTYTKVYPFTYSFLDEKLEALYHSEQRLGKIFGIFAGLALLIASLGLFGLALFTAERRTKEIGIRKVLGASVAGIIGLLLKDFVKLVLAANLIAWPVAYYAMNQWLQDFAYRINMNWWMFALAGGLALLIALLTVSSQAIKAALANPVEALRYE